MRRRQTHRAILGLGPDEAAFLEPLREQAKALPVPPQNLDQVTAAAAEDKQLAAEWILGKLVLRERREAIESPAQVGMPAGQPDMYRSAAARSTAEPGDHRTQHRDRRVPADQNSATRRQNDFNRRCTVIRGGRRKRVRRGEHLSVTPTAPAQSPIASPVRKPALTGEAPPAVQQAWANIIPRRDVADARPGLPALSHDPQLFRDAPAPPPFTAGDDFDGSIGHSP